ncbi:MAG: Phosphoglycerate kinase [Streblomastix strix]|uniref:phosphoglycerate kinase n=1 Tax=Streblomastix strix TaxID=222440 RepID=A0A5J4UTN6_9EUKA|nr:MAG: Phosphoglycerate kinase [Streblomastix strix]
MKVLLTNEHLLGIQGIKIILISHVGSPNGINQSELSLKPVADELQRILGDRAKVKFSTVHLKVAFVVSIAYFFPGESLNVDNLKKEAQILSQAYYTLSRPFVTVLGGVRIIEKIIVMYNLGQVPVQSNFLSF